MDVHVITVPYDSGYRLARMGAGPDSVLEAGLLQSLQQAGHNTSIERIELNQTFLPEIGTAFRLNRAISHAVKNCVSAGHFPLVLSGNCNASIGLFSGLGSAESTGVLWFDAHGDFNTPETSASGFLDGMALAILTGRCWQALSQNIPGFEPVPESHVMLLGARDIDPEEKLLLLHSKLAWIPPDRFADELAENLQRLKGTCGQVLVHIDVDVLDPVEAPANEYVAPNGLAVNQLLVAMKKIKSELAIAGACFAAYDPSFDPNKVTAKAAIRAALEMLS